MCWKHNAIMFAIKEEECAAVLVLRVCNNLEDLTVRRVQGNQGSGTSLRRGIATAFVAGGIINCAIGDSAVALKSLALPFPAEFRDASPIEPQREHASQSWAPHQA